MLEHLLVVVEEHDVASEALSVAAKAAAIMDKVEKQLIIPKYTM